METTTIPTIQLVRMIGQLEDDLATGRWESQGDVARAEANLTNLLAEYDAR